MDLYSWGGVPYILGPSVSWGAGKKTPNENVGKKRGEKKRFSLFFFRAFFGLHPS